MEFIHQFRCVTGFGIRKDVYKAPHSFRGRNGKFKPPSVGEKRLVINGEIKE